MPALNVLASRPGIEPRRPAAFRRDLPARGDIENDRLTDYRWECYSLVCTS